MTPFAYFAGPDKTQLKLVHGPFGPSVMHSTLDFFPRPARKEMNVLEKLRAYCPNIYCG